MIKKSNLLVRYIKLFIGFFVCALGMSLYYYSNLGMDPWNVFQEGLSLYLPITIGQASQVIGVLIIVICCFFKIYPGIATLLNMFFIGLFMDLIIASNIISTPNTVIGKLLMCLAGIASLSYGIYLYITQELGAGPRDGLMMAITQRTRFKVGAVKNTMEIIVVIIGIILGGKFGIGTILASVLGGFALQIVFNIFKVNPKEIEQQTIVDIYKKVRNS